MKHLLIVLLALAPLVPSRAQLVNPAAAANAASGASSTQSVPAPPRNIMPVGLNHKPNPVAPPSEIAGPIDRFFKTLRVEPNPAGNTPDSYAKAYEDFFSGTRLGVQKEKISIFISKTQEAFGLYGPLKDYEIFDNYSIGSNVLVLTYLTRHSMQPLRWRFIYYRPDKTWTLINMGFDDVLLDMLD